MPVAIALQGMPVCCAVSGAWAIARPPNSLINLMPELPLLPVPERTTPTAHLLILGERGEERVDRAAGSATLVERAQTQHASFDRHLAVGQDHVDAVRLDRRTLADRAHAHPGVPAQQLDHVALPGRIEMLDDHECHAAVRRHRVEQLLERVEAASRRPDPDDRKGSRAGCLRRPGRREADRLPPLACFRRSACWLPRITGIPFGKFLPQCTQRTAPTSETIPRRTS